MNRLPPIFALVIASLMSCSPGSKPPVAEPEPIPEPAAAPPVSAAEPPESPEPQEEEQEEEPRDEEHSIELRDAARAGNFKRVRELAEMPGVSIHYHLKTEFTRDHLLTGFTATDLAAYHGDIDAFDFLHKRGGGTGRALAGAVLGKQLEMAEYLVDQKLVTPLELGDAFATACFESDLELMTFLLEVGADPDAPTYFYEGRATCLGYALSQDDRKMVKLVLKHKGDPNHAEENVLPPLHYVAVYGAKPASLDWLPRKGLDLDIRNDSGLTPLYTLLDLDQFPEVTKWLVSRGADVNAASEYGTTPLMLAASNDNLSMTRLLLRNGADAKAKDADGDSAIDRAKAGSKVEAALKGKGAKRVK